MKVFLDTNVLMDVLARREPFFEQALAVWSLAEQGRVDVSISAISFNNLHYVIGRLSSARKARLAMQMLRDTFKVVPLDSQILNQAIDSNIADFEDAIQLFSALRAGATCLVTRNPGDFREADLAVQTPGEFLAALTAR